MKKDKEIEIKLGDTFRVTPRGVEVTRPNGKVDMLPTAEPDYKALCEQLVHALVDDVSVTPLQIIKALLGCYRREHDWSEDSDPNATDYCLNEADEAIQKFELAVAAARAAGIEVINEME